MATRQRLMELMERVNNIPNNKWGNEELTYILIGYVQESLDTLDKALRYYLDPFTKEAYDKLSNLNLIMGKSTDKLSFINQNVEPQSINKIKSDINRFLKIAVDDIDELRDIEISEYHNGYIILGTDIWKTRNYFSNKFFSTYSFSRSLPNISHHLGVSKINLNDNDKIIYT